MHEAKQEEPTQEARLLLYFSGTNAQFDEGYFQKVFALARSDLLLREMITQNLVNKLRTFKPYIHLLFAEVLADSYYYLPLADFLNQVLYDKELELSSSLELAIIDALATPRVIRLLPDHTESYWAIVNYLCLKMRSLIESVRYTALRSYSRLLEQEQGGNFGQFLKRISGQMVEKELLARNMSASKGIILQLLQDEHSHLRVLCLECLPKLKLKNEETKALMVYMLNDEHHLVRQSALRMLGAMGSRLEMTREELHTLMVCLKEKDVLMREAVYECLAVLKIKADCDILVVIERLYQALLVYRGDKKTIYRTLYNIGKTHADYVTANFQTLYGYSNEEESNCRGMLYKAKLLLVYTAAMDNFFGNSATPIILPSYFPCHLLYVRDMESYLFQNIISQHTSNPTILTNKIVHNKFLLASFVEAEMQRSIGFFHRILAYVRLALRESVSQDVLERICFDFSLTPAQHKIVQELVELPMRQNYERETALGSLLMRIIEMRDSGPAPTLNRFMFSKHEPNMLMAPNQEAFLGGLYLRCVPNRLMSMRHYRNPFDPRTEETVLQVVKVSELERARENAKWVYLRFELAPYAEVKCVFFSVGATYMLEEYGVC